MSFPRAWAKYFGLKERLRQNTKIGNGLTVMYLLRSYLDLNFAKLVRPSSHLIVVVVVVVHALLSCCGSVSVEEFYY